MNNVDPVVHSLGPEFPGEPILSRIREVSALARWPELDALLFPPGQTRHVARLDWQLPGLGCVAVGGSVTDALYAMTALACIQISIILVDAWLDEEPSGPHLQLGPGRSANLAVALQSAAHVLVERSPVSAERRAAASLVLSQMALDTAAGQELDVQNFSGEESYWQVVRSKSTPFYGAGLEAGAYLGGASPELANSIRSIGALLGEAVQIADDLEDAFKVPANPDWMQGRNNLAILYALQAEFPEKERFLELKAQAHVPLHLEEAQKLLLRSGAASYCIYHLVERHRAIHTAIQKLPLQDRDLLQSLIDIQLAPTRNLLARLGLSLPANLPERL